MQYPRNITMVALTASLLGTGCATTPPEGDYAHIRLVHPDAGSNLDGCERLEAFDVVAAHTLTAPADTNVRPKAQARAAEHPDADTAAVVDRTLESISVLAMPSYRYTFFSYQCFD